MLLKRKRQDLSIYLSVFCWLIKSKRTNSEKIIAMCLSCSERELSFELLFRKGTGGMEGGTEASAGSHVSCPGFSKVPITHEWSFSPLLSPPIEDLGEDAEKGERRFKDR